MWEVERETIEKAIDLCQGNVPKAAALLGISTSTIYRKKQAWSSRDQ
jgi:transcriptional regulator of acetoin/glycerol metabolism